MANASQQARQGHGAAWHKNCSRRTLHRSIRLVSQMTHVTNGTNLPRPYQRNTINHDSLQLEAAAAVVHDREPYLRWKYSMRSFSKRSRDHRRSRSRTLNSMYISYPVRQNLTSLCTYFEQARFLPVRPALKVYKRHLMQPDNVPVGILAFILDASQRSLPEIGLHD